MIILENNIIKATINPLGAELQSVYHKQFDLEYIWDGNPEFWAKHSPVLFPIVGGLINDTFFYKGQEFTLPKHGFARDITFEVENTSAESASFTLTSTAATLKMYPFNFLLRISYKLESSKLLVNYEVENLSEETMYFSIGAHPAFNIPLTKQTAYEDYFFEFEKEENSSRYVVNGNFLGGPVPYFNNQTQLALKKSLFYDEALIFKDLKSDWISIKSTKNAHGIKFDFPGFPYMGIWSATDAPFVCIEPWCGIPDSENHSQHIEEKEGIIPLEKNSRSIKSWSIDFF